MHLKTNVEFNRRVLTPVLPLPSRQSHSWCCAQKIRNLCSWPTRTNWTNPFRLACWNADGVLGRKRELDLFLGQHGIHIRLLNEFLLKWSAVFRLANYVCHRIDWLTEGGGTAMLVCRGIVHHAVPCQGLQHLKSTTIYVMFASKPAKILSAYISPVPNTVPYNPSATSDVPDIIITKDIVSLLYQTTYSALCSDHLLKLVDKQCRSSSLNSPGRPEFRRTDRPKFQASIEAGLPSNPYLTIEVSIEACLKELQMLSPN